MEITKDDSHKFKPKEYKRSGQGFEVVGSVTGDDLNDLLQMATDTLKRSGTCKYENDEAGLQRFKSRTLDFLEFLRVQNNGGGSLTPTVESWCTYLGISRVTLMNYEHKRSESWKEYIGYIKNVLMACKVELSAKGKLPPLIFIFDATNNGAQYYNTSEFKLTKTPDAEVIERATAESPESIAERYRARLADLQSDSEN